MYIAMLQNGGRADEAQQLYDGTPTPYNMYWYVQAAFLPEISKLRREGKLKQGKKVISRSSVYSDRDDILSIFLEGPNRIISESR